MAIDKRINIISFLGWILSVILVFKFVLPIYSILIIPGLWLGVTAAGVFKIRLNYYFKSHRRFNAATDREIALTFQRQPGDRTADILNLLERYRQKATFFCVGNQVDQRPKEARSITEKGHAIGNQTYAEPLNFFLFKQKRLLKEIEACHEAIASQTGERATLLKTPFGMSNPRLPKVLDITAYKSVTPSIEITRETEPGKALKNLPPGAVIGIAETVNVETLERILDYLHKQAITSVALSADKLR